MTRVLVSGYYGFGNAGDEAVLAGIIRGLRDRVRDVQFSVISGRAASTRQLHGVDAISRGRFRDIWSAVGASDLVLSGGGSLLQDVTGFKSVPYYLGIAAMGLLRRRPVMFCAQGIGPLRSPVSRGLVRLVANRVQAITVRDEESAQILHTLAVHRPSVRVTADAALLLPPGEAATGARLLTAAGLPAGSGPVVGVALRPLAGTLRSVGEAFIRELAAGLDELVAAVDARIVFVPLQPARDIAIAQEVRGLMQRTTTVLGPEHDFWQVMNAVAACDLVVGMRYHSLLFAAMARRPVVGLAYDPKNSYLLRSLGLAPPLTVTELTAAGLAAAAQARLQTGQATGADRARLAERLAGLADEARRNAQVAADLLGREVAK